MAFSESKYPTEGEIDRCLRNYYEDGNIVSSYAIVVYPPVGEYYLKASEGLCAAKGPDHFYSNPTSK